MKRGQKGFTIIETLLILILLAILGFTGYYVWHTQRQTDKTLNAASNEKLATPSKKTTAVTAAGASKLVSDFYSQVYQALGGGSASATPNNGQEKALVQKDGTASLLSAYSSAKDMDALTCGQNYAAFSVTKSTISGDKATVTVHEAFANTPIDFTVTVVNSGGLKIDAVHCPQS